MKHLFSTLLAAVTLTANAQTEVTTAQLKGLYKTDLNVKSISVHDPSIVFAPQQSRFYCIGSHMGMGWTADLMNWTSLYSETKDSRLWGKRDASGKVTACSYDEAFAEAGKWGASQRGNNGSVAGNQWAPDMLWNEHMQKWCIYQSLNGDNWKSVIVLMTSEKPTGPFVYEGPIVYSGFQTLFDAKGATYKDTDLERVIGAQPKLPARYDQGSRWGEYWPNNIDPCTFFDEEGELWMAYGSWSGGIWMLKLDKETGLRDYTHTYDSDFAAKGKSCTSDPYFGIRIAGGHYVSGEGPYIQHIGSYYYLFMSYGFYSPDGGYEMRVFRSDRPEGPYKDQAGNLATYTGYQMNYGRNAATNRGEKLMGAYKWDFMTLGECAQGHNSACLDDKGRAFLCYHTKFNNGTAWHSVRIHQLFQNQQGWLVAAPFQYRGEELNQDSIAARERWTVDDICGEYQLLVHKYKMDYEKMEEVHPVAITLTPDGRISGAKNGTWSRTEGTDYITVKLGNATYTGVLVEQQMEPSNIKALCFTCANNVSGENIWGAKMQPLYALSHVVNNIPWEASPNKLVSSHISLMSHLPYGATMQWSSSRPDVISETGKYSPQEENTPVELTVKVQAGQLFWTNTYKVTAKAAVQPAGDYLSGLLAYYCFDDDANLNAYDASQKAVLYTRSGSGAEKPSKQTDYDRIGSILRTHQSAAGNSYIRIPNPLKGIEAPAFTISMWIKRLDNNRWDNLFALATSTSTTTGKRLYVNGTGYVGFNDGAGHWFDANHPDAFAGTIIPAGQWTWVTLTYSRQNGVRLYVNGAVKRFTNAFNSSDAASYSKYDYSGVEAVATAATYLYLGAGSFWGSADVLYDEVMIYDRELSSTDVSSLRTMQNRVTDFTPAATPVVAPSATYTSRSGMYDLTGRRLDSAPQKGIYIIDGKKIKR